MVEARMETETTADKPGDGKLVEAARKVEQGIGAAKERIGGAIETAKEKAHLSGKTMSDVAGDVKTYASEHPGHTILVSVGVGAILGWLIGRRR